MLWIENVVDKDTLPAGYLLHVVMLPMSNDGQYLSSIFTHHMIDKEYALSKAGVHDPEYARELNQKRSDRLRIVAKKRRENRGYLMAHQQREDLHALRLPEIQDNEDV